MDTNETDAPSTSGEPDPAVVAVTETKVYADGSSATGPGPLPDLSPAEQADAQRMQAEQDAAAGMSALPPGFALSALPEPASHAEQARAPLNIVFSDKQVLNALGQPAGPDILIGSSILPAHVNIPDADGEFHQFQLGEIVASAHQVSGLSVGDWNALPNEDRETRLAAEITVRANIFRSQSADRPQGLHSNLIEIELARRLSEIETSEAFQPPIAAEGSIEHFMDEDDAGTRRLMRVVVDTDGALRKVATGI